MRERIYLNNDWKFTTSFKDDLIQDNTGMEGLEDVRLPHNVKELPFNYFSEEDYQMVSGYARKVSLSPEWKGKSFFVTFEAVAHEATVYINGTQAAIHRCGYTAFTVDITPYVGFDVDNYIVVKVDSRESLNVPPFGFVVDYLTYGGIYREVYLDVVDAVSIKDVFVKTKQVLEDKKKLELEITLEGMIKESLYAQVYLGDELLDSISITDSFTTWACEVTKVNLWSIEHPMLYDVTVVLQDISLELDRITVRTGFREVKFCNDGFYLNGQRVKLRGVNRHQSYPYVGYAMPKSPQQRDADIIRNELGMNAVRTSHYPQSKYFLDRCDELGLLVFTEIPGWQHIGDEEWKEQAKKNVEEMVLQYRNHPSIVLWGVRINESQDDDELYEKTNQLAHNLDPTRQTGGVRYIKKSHMLEDVYTFNDFSFDGLGNGIEKKHKVASKSDAPYLVSEYNGHMYPTKAFDDEEHRLEHALRHAKVLDAILGDDGVSGGFAWCMFDYNTHKDFGSGDKICYHGLMDMFRNPKLAAAVYQSQGANNTVLELGTSMDIGEHPGGRQGKIYAFTNADSVRVYKNNELIKEFWPNTEEFRHLEHPPILIDDLIGDRLMEAEGFGRRKAEQVKGLLGDFAEHGFRLPLKSKLMAVKLMVLNKLTFQDAYRLYSTYYSDWGSQARKYRFDAIKNGELAVSIVKCPSDRAHLEVDVSHTKLLEDNTYDVACIRIQAKGQQGSNLTYYQEALELRAEGAIEIIGPRIISMKGGCAGTYVKSTSKAGEGKLLIISNSMEAVELNFQVIMND